MTEEHDKGISFHGTNTSFESFSFDARPKGAALRPPSESEPDTPKPLRSSNRSPERLMDLWCRLIVLIERLFSRIEQGIGWLLDSEQVPRYMFLLTLLSGVGLLIAAISVLVVR